MYYVYVLLSAKDGYLYVGETHDLRQRFLAHKSGNVFSTKNHLPLKLIYYEAYLNKIDALKREKMLKHHGSVIGHLKKRIINSAYEVVPKERD